MRRLAVPVFLLSSLFYALAAQQSPTKAGDAGVAERLADEGAAGARRRADGDA